MKKIKLLSLVLAILMLAGMATLFSSCGTEPGVITPSEETVEVDLTGYALLYGESQSGTTFTRTVRGQFERFATLLNGATGVNFRLQQASRKDAEEGAKEILIGLTDRAESTAALEEIEGEGFIIQVLENKIVLVGTNNLYTAMAVDYFVKSYLTGKEKASKTLTLNETVNANEMQSVVLSSSAYTADDIEGSYTYVYQNGLGMIPSPYDSLSTDVSVSRYKEAPMILAANLTEKMAGIVKLSQKHFPVGTDAVTNEKEVLIGLTAREESKQALTEINETEYIITVRGERVVINAWNNEALTQAYDAYNDVIKEATVKDAEGNTVISLPRDFRLIAEAEHSWKTDFPKPQGEGIALYNTMDNNDGSLQYLYRGTGVNKTAYDAYIAQLKAAGYTEVKAGSEAEGSVFKFFTNKAKDTALYVALNAYAHKDDFAEFDDTIIKQIDKQVIDPYGFEASIRIISSTVENAFLPDTTLLSKSSYDRITDTTITSMPIYSKAVGHCYIVTLEDGRFIVYDGGGENGGSREYDTLMNLLRELNKQVTGQETGKENKIHIAAWVLSHAHWDHYTAFRKMLEKYGKSGELKMDYMIANIPSAEAYCAGNNFAEVSGVMTPDDIKSLQASITGGFKLIKPHTGMKFHIANVEFETITTWEDLNPVMCSNTNDTNTVLRLTISNQKNSEKTTLMWLGDANRLQSRFMCATFGTYLKSDMSTVAHHGNAGCEIDLYEMLDPETLFWTHHAKAVQDYLNPAKTGWVNQVDQYFAYKLASVKRIFANGGQMFTSGAGTPMDQVANGEIPAFNGYMQLHFVDGRPDFDHVKELSFEFEKDNSGNWITKSVTVSELAHTDISGGAEAYKANQNVMTFCSNYMIKCMNGCPTGEHTH